MKRWVVIDNNLREIEVVRRPTKNEWYDWHVSPNRVIRRQSKGYPTAYAAMRENIFEKLMRIAIRGNEAGPNQVFTIVDDFWDDIMTLICQFQTAPCHGAVPLAIKSKEKT